MAVKHFTAVVEDPTAEPTLNSMNAALLACAEGDWEKATMVLRGLLLSSRRQCSRLLGSISTRVPQTDYRPRLWNKSRPGSPLLGVRLAFSPDKYSL